MRTPPSTHPCNLLTFFPGRTQATNQNNKPHNQLYDSTSLTRSFILATYLLFSCSCSLLTLPRHKPPSPQQQRQKQQRDTQRQQHTNTLSNRQSAKMSLSSLPYRELNLLMDKCVELDYPVSRDFALHYLERSGNSIIRAMNSIKRNIDRRKSSSLPSSHNPVAPHR